MAQAPRQVPPGQVTFQPDRATQYACDQIGRYAREHGVILSWGQAQVRWDNAMAAYFYATLKSEFYYRRVWDTKTAGKQGVGRWTEETCTRTRRHSALRQLAPVYEVQQFNQHP